MDYLIALGIFVVLFANIVDNVWPPTEAVPAREQHAGKNQPLTDAGSVADRERAIAA
jgi:hypothetical protein